MPHKSPTVLPLTIEINMTDEPKTQESPETVPKEQYFRLAADFENYRRAMELQLLEIGKFASQSVVLKMVDVMDHMDQAVAHATDAVRSEEEWFRGLTQIDATFHETMKQFGVSRIDTSGKPFDPKTMEAVSMTGGGESQTVKEEVRAGYLMHERVIRPARVIIYE